MSVLVVNYRCASATRRLVDSLVAGTDGALCVSIVDNSLDQNEADALADLVVDARNAGVCCHLTISPANLGYAAGNNLAYEAIPHAAPGTIVVANPDTAIVTGRLSALSRALAGNPGLVAAPTTLAGTGEKPAVGAVLAKATGRSSPLAQPPPDALGLGTWQLPYPMGHFWAVTRATWDLLDGLSPRFFLYCEELDFVMRSAEAQRPLSLAVAEGLIVSHAGALTTREDASSKGAVTFEHATRSRIVLYRRHRALRPWLLLLILSRALCALGLLAGGRRGGSAAVLRGLRGGLLPKGRGLRRRQRGAPH